MNVLEFKYICLVLSFRLELLLPALPQLRLLLKSFGLCSDSSSRLLLGDDGAISSAAAHFGVADGCPQCVVDLAGHGCSGLCIVTTACSEAPMMV